VISLSGALKQFRRWRWARRATAAGFLCLLVLGGFEWFPWFKGSMTATTVCGIVPFTDPLCALEITLATRNWHASMLVGAAALVMFAALFGPLFCGWLCPLGFLLDINDAFRRLVGRLVRRRPTRRVRAPSAIKYGVLGLVLGLSLVARLPAFQVLSPINILVWGIVFTTGPALFVLAGIAVLEYVFPRVWCRSVCPLGALYNLVGRFGLLRVRINQAATCRQHCGQCTQHCPMGIRVTEDYTAQGKRTINHMDCTRCGDCIDTCPNGVLRFGFGQPEHLTAENAEFAES